MELRDNPVITSATQAGANVPLGAEADNVFITWTVNGQKYKTTLTEFFNNWQDFKENNPFIIFSKEEPQDPVRVWYQTQD